MELASLVSAAQVATPDIRITWRDRIAAYGPRAIDAMKPWLGQPMLAAFAVRVIERAGRESIEADSFAIEALRHARAKAPAVIKGDIDVALRHLRQDAAPPTFAPTAVRVTDTPRSRAYRAEPHPRMVVRRRRGDGATIAGPTPAKG
jgi:hypothetical protein